MSDQGVIDPRAVLGLEPEALPRHVAIIMDGNGRWARARGEPRTFGHRQAHRAVRETVTTAARLQLPALTLYAFSQENWRRPAEETSALMSLAGEFLIRERTTLTENNVRLIHLGRREGLPPAVLDELDRSLEASRHCSGLKLGLALNYSSRAELLDAFRSLAGRVQAGELEASEVNEGHISGALYSREFGDVDLLIRTAGQLRISNFLLWQISYAELWVTPTLWPDFGQTELFAALRAYADRDRRFGGLSDSAGSAGAEPGARERRP